MVRIKLERVERYTLTWMENDIYYVRIFADSGILSKEENAQTFIRSITLFIKKSNTQTLSQVFLCKFTGGCIYLTQSKSEMLYLQLFYFTFSRMKTMETLEFINKNRTRLGGSFGSHLICSFNFQFKLPKDRLLY